MTHYLTFSKMQGLGNDYLYFDCTQNPFPRPETASPILSDRHFGVGGDGIILILQSNIADFRMRMFNIDGSEAQMCGNGVRCIAKYVYEKGLTTKTTINLETLGGIKELKLHLKDNIVDSVEVDMGEPIFQGLKIPTILNTDRVLNETIRVKDREFIISSVSMGNPHCVIFTDEIDDEIFKAYSPLLEVHEFFPERVNVHFAKVISPKQIKMRVWERGCGETLSSGTSASAVAVLSHTLGYTERDVMVELRGGNLKVTYREDNRVIIQGPAKFTFEGTVPVTW